MKPGRYFPTIRSDPQLDVMQATTEPRSSAEGKLSATRTTCPDTAESPSDRAPERWVISYGIAGDLRFISHHDTIRLFQRALARARLPVRHSQGFNPHARLSIPVPRPVGLSSEAEALVVEFDEPISADDVLTRLAAQLPAGMQLFAARPLASGESVQPELVRYRLDVDPLKRDELAASITRLMDATTLPIERINRKDGTRRTIDVRSYLDDLTMSEQGIDFALRVTQRGTAKPSEVAALLGFDARTINHRIHRLAVQWRNDEH